MSEHTIDSEDDGEPESEAVPKSTLGKVMLDSATPPATRVRAADSILNHTAKAIEIEDIEARVSDLERAAEEASRKK
jgi:hypothetical protein